MCFVHKRVRFILLHLIFLFVSMCACVLKYFLLSCGSNDLLSTKTKMEKSWDQENGVESVDRKKALSKALDIIVPLLMGWGTVERGGMGNWRVFYGSW